MVKQCGIQDANGPCTERATHTNPRADSSSAGPNESSYRPAGLPVRPAYACTKHANVGMPGYRRFYNR
jgi:hypothetical protein